MKTLRILVACVSVAAILAVGAVVALAAPHAVRGSAAFAAYCPDKARRADALEQFEQQMAKQRASYFKTHKKAAARAAFVKKQAAERQKLVSALANCG